MSLCCWTVFRSPTCHHRLHHPSLISTGPSRRRSLSCDGTIGHVLKTTIPCVRITRELRRLNSDLVNRKRSTQPVPTVPCRLSSRPTDTCVRYGFTRGVFQEIALIWGT